jgi:hypothetical protein
VQAVRLDAPEARRGGGSLRLGFREARRAGGQLEKRFRFGFHEFLPPIERVLPVVGEIGIALDEKS